MGGQGRVHPQHRNVLSKRFCQAVVSALDVFPTIARYVDEYPLGFGIATVHSIPNGFVFDPFARGAIRARRGFALKSSAASRPKSRLAWTATWYLISSRTARASVAGVD